MHSRVSLVAAYLTQNMMHDAFIFSLLCLQSTDPATAVLPNQDEAFVLLLKAEVMKNE